MFWKAIFTGFALASLALAQGGGMGGMGGGGGDMGGGGGGGGDMGGGGGAPSGAPMARQQKQTKAEMMISRLKLNKDQTSEFVSILQSTAKDASPVIQEVAQSRDRLVNAMLNGKSEADLAPLRKALSEAQFQMTGVEVKAFQRIVGLLKPNQVAKAPEAFELMADIFMPVPNTGGGGRGRRGGGGDRGGR